MNVSLELWPTRKSVETGDLELCVGDGCSSTSLVQILGLILQMPEIGTVGKWDRRVLGIGRHGDLLSSNSPVVRKSGRKKVREDRQQMGGLLPFPRTGCVPNARGIVTQSPIGEVHPTTLSPGRFKRAI